MIIETRKTAAGTEYWDNVEKKVLFVPADKEPGFEVTKNPESMLTQDDTQDNIQVIDNDTGVDLDAMDLEELLSFAEHNNIEVPGNMKKEETIRKHIEEALTATDPE